MPLTLAAISPKAFTLTLMLLGEGAESAVWSPLLFVSSARGAAVRRSNGLSVDRRPSSAIWSHISISHRLLHTRTTGAMDDHTQRSQPSRPRCCCNALAIAGVAAQSSCSAKRQRTADDDDASVALPNNAGNAWSQLLLLQLQLSYCRSVALVGPRPRRPMDDPALAAAATLL